MYGVGICSRWLDVIFKQGSKRIMSRAKLLWESVMEEHYTMRTDECEESFIKPQTKSNVIIQKQEGVIL
jgi:hypothetical protein